MEEFEGGMFEEGDFEVVDECTGEEDASPVSGETPKQTDDVEPEEQGEKTVPAEKENNVDQQKEIEKSVQSPEDKPSPSDGNKIDFTADISMDTHEEENHDEVLKLTIEGDTIRDLEETLKMDEEIRNPDHSNETTPVVEPILPEHAWYEEKIKAKEVILKERLTKLSRVLELSYPQYKPWLDHMESPLCHLDLPRRCPLDKPYTNRWKFFCSRKPVQESTNKDEDSAEGTVDKKLETVWRLGPADGTGVNTDNASQYPSFVMRVVKVFEEFIQNIEQEQQQPLPDEQTTVDKETPVDQDESVKQDLAVDEKPATESVVEDVDKTIEEAKPDEDLAEDTTNDQVGDSTDSTHNWLWLLVRSNSRDELMIFATGKKISDETMQKLKQTFESGPGKDCNVKSLYCKSIAGKPTNAAASNITFLLGSEALDETVGNVKIQLAPKTNFWCNAAGAEKLGEAVGDMLVPKIKTTVLEVGCGLGIIGLMVAPRCKLVIGVDAPSEVEEAEMTSELNKISNTTFIKGQPKEVMEKADALLKNKSAVAIVNGNTKLGRDIDVMTALRKIPSLHRVVMITTLTKQSVRAILELTKPAEASIGNPFMAVRAVMVDTLPTGPHFEVVIRMERLAVHKSAQPWFWNHVRFRAGLGHAMKENEAKKPTSKLPVNKKAKKVPIKSTSKGAQNAQAALYRRAKANRSNRRNKIAKQKAANQGIVLGTVTGVVRNLPNLVKNPMANVARTGKTPPKGKRPHSPDNTKVPTKFAKNKPNDTPQTTGESPQSPDPLNPVQVVKPVKSSNTSSPLKKNPLARNPTGRRQRLRAQKRKRRRGMSDGGKQGGAIPGEKRVRGYESGGGDLRGRLSDARPDHYLMNQVHEPQVLFNMVQQRLSGQEPVGEFTAKLQNVLNMVLNVDQQNKFNNQLSRSVWDRIAPPENPGYSPPQNMPRDSPMFRDRYPRDIAPQDIVVTTPNREFGQGGSQGPMPLFPQRPIDRTKIMPAGMTPLETQRGQGTGHGMPERAQSRDFRKLGNDQNNDWNRRNQFNKNRTDQPMTKSAIPPPMEIARPLSPKRPLLSPPRANSPQRRYVPSFAQQEIRRPKSPPRRQIPDSSRNPHSEIFQRRPTALQGGRQQTQSLDTTTRGMSSPRRDQSASGRPLSPSRRFDDDWDANRSTMQPGNWNQRQGMQMQQQQLQQQQQQQQQPQQQRNANRNMPDKRWSNERPQSTAPNWNNQSSNERFRKDQKEGTWMSGGGNIWNSKSITSKPGTKDQWLQGMEKQWGGNSGGGNSAQGPSGDHWDARNKDSFYTGSNNRMDNYRDSSKGNDLPEDAKDPWGDDAGAKSRSSGNWGRDSNDKMDQNWSMKSSGNNWQLKGMSSMNLSKPMWLNTSNQNSNEQQRWMSQNDVARNSLLSSNWQGSSNYGMSSMRGQNFSGFSQQQRQNAFGSNNFKDGR